MARPSAVPAAAVAALLCALGALGCAAAKPSVPPVNIEAVKAVPTNGSGVLDSTLEELVYGNELFSSRGFWYDIRKWGARSHTCDNRPDSVTCMACSQNMPNFAADAGVVPIAAASELFFDVEKGATCGMCLQVYMPPGKFSSPDCGDPWALNNIADCPGIGSSPYITSVNQDWAYGAKVTYDPAMGMSYFTAAIIEWFDRNQSLPYALSYPMKGGDVSTMGSWPVQYHGVPCPVGNHKLQYQFLNYSTPVPMAVQTGMSWLHSAPTINTPRAEALKLCDNEFGVPCGTFAVAGEKGPLENIKLAITGSRVPIAAVRMHLADGEWINADRSGDGYWQGSSRTGYVQDPWQPLTVEVYCSDGSPPLNETLVPANMMCSYQDPDCKTFEGTIQC